MSLELTSQVGNIVLTSGNAGAAAEAAASAAAEAASSTGALSPSAAAALGVGLAAFGAGYAERGIGAAAVGAMAENEDLFVRGLILTVLPETLVILALVAIFLV
ncbi:F0F1 ATP synthase subunit C [Halonotius aquaticus]|uniref:F0F1 ATP synthase subunit C n=1 Tax=Halonotius aquaticus TaxID=2216978 RepID=A0A3A6QAW7_9EURY|nr:F0F1 ATP synthase subunit C [Halonotius aquaticus]